MKKYLPLPCDGELHLIVAPSWAYMVAPAFNLTITPGFPKSSISTSPINPRWIWALARQATARTLDDVTKRILGIFKSDRFTFFHCPYAARHRMLLVFSTEDFSHGPAAFGVCGINSRGLANLLNGNQLRKTLGLKNYEPTVTDIVSNVQWNDKCGAHCAKDQCAFKLSCGNQY